MNERAVDEPVPATAGAAHGVHFRAVSCRLGGRAARFAVRELTLECPAGVVTCLAGPNGAGKSTALAIAAGLRSPDAGEVRLAGRRAGSRDAPPVGYLPQHSTFPPEMTVGEALSFSGAEPALLAETVRAALAPLWQRPIGGLSSGEVRRVGVAVALGVPARILLLDEPFVGLDLDTLELLVGRLHARCEAGHTVVLASHDHETVDRLRPRLAVLFEGRLVHASGPGLTDTRRRVRGALREAVGVADAPPGQDRGRR